ncbi:hypothetical protein THZG08_260045 [Vibrio owensii]|uniref:Uncharacterized protein n=1 Tax=Vibrio campbellii TaxID=680 RepID=A0AAQ2Y649_9VIBR|nr:hypothetical protein [Vibrio campbellii]WDG11989.1 hypothetical protein PUN50_27235 [Vibrio campbellii]CAH1525916.1 hypothetical protein THZG08_260045 [Vibrio owensii]CAH1565396.1 hypothetical protein THOA03_270066 [Vibrio owensii]
MDSSTLLDNLMFWGIFLPVFWLVWKSHTPRLWLGAYWTLFQRNLMPILRMTLSRQRP